MKGKLCVFSEYTNCYQNVSRKVNFIFSPDVCENLYWYWYINNLSQGQVGLGHMGRVRNSEGRVFGGKGGKNVNSQRRCPVE